MIIYNNVNNNNNNSVGDYKTGKHTEPGGIGKKRVKVTTSTHSGLLEKKKSKKNQRLSGENIEFLSELGYKVN